MLILVHVFIYIKTMLLYLRSPPRCLLYFKSHPSHWTWKCSVVNVAQWWVKIYCGFTQVWIHERFLEWLNRTFLFIVPVKPSELPFHQILSVYVKVSQTRPAGQSSSYPSYIVACAFLKDQSRRSPSPWGTLDYVIILSFSLSPPAALCLEF